MSQITVAVSKHVDSMGLKKKGGAGDTWGYDQYIITRLVLRNRLCSFHPNQTAWKIVGLEERYGRGL